MVRSVFHLLARLAALGATLATWSVAGPVREGLRRAGFVTERHPASAPKWQMLRGRLACEPACLDTAGGLGWSPRVVIGAGIAGCTVERLTERGWTVELVDRALPANGASGNLAGVLRPLPSLDDNRMSRLTRAGSLYAWRRIHQLLARSLALRADDCGVLHLARDTTQEAKMRAAVERLALPPDHLRFVGVDEAAELAGCAGRQWRLVVRRQRLGAAAQPVRGKPRSGGGAPAHALRPDRGAARARRQRPGTRSVPTTARSRARRW